MPPKSKTRNTPEGSNAGSTKSHLAKLVLSVIIGGSSNLHGQEYKAAYIQNGEVGIALHGTSSMRALTHGASASEVHWAEDGKRILYISPSKQANTLADMVVISSDDGKELNRIHIEKMAKDGLTILNDMRFVEKSGWINSQSVYVYGSEHPSVPSLETFDLTTSKATDTFYPYTFASCASKGLFSQITVSPKAAELRLLVDDKQKYSIEDDLIPRGLTWNADCTELAFLAYEQTSDASGTFFWVHGKDVTKISLPSGFSALNLLAVKQTFVAISPQGEYLQLDKEKSRLIPCTEEVQELIEQKADMAQSFRQLGADQVEYWPDVLTAEPVTRIRGAVHAK